MGEQNTPEKGDREKIKNLEKRRKRQNGKLGKDENKLLYDLYKRVKNAKSETGVGKSDLNSSDDVNKSFEKAVRNVGGNVINVATTRPKYVSKKAKKDDYDEEFDYNKVETTIVNPGQIDYLNFDYNSVETKTITSGVIDYLAPLNCKAISAQSSFDEQLETIGDYSASNENSTPDSSVAGSLKHKNKKKNRNERVSTIQDLKLTNKMLLEKCNEISKQFESNLAENNPRRSSSSPKMEHSEKMKLKNEKRKLKTKEKMKAKKEKKGSGVSLSKSESECAQVDSDLLKIAENYPQVELCREAEIKYFSS